MAFVFRSELKSVFEVKGDPDLGPGYYHKEDPKSKRKSPNKIPFLASSPRTKTKKFQEVPGPGAYYNDEQFDKIFKNTYNNNQPCGGNLKILNDEKNQNVNIDVIYRALENENIINDADPIHLFVDEQFEKLGFLSKNKRFKEMQSLEVPGPGAYLRAKSKSAKNMNKKNDKEKLKKIHLAQMNKQKVETIPAKNHVFGYEFDQEGNLKPNADPLKDRKHLGIKGSSVGPGDYELVKEKDWIKKGTLAWGRAPSQTQNNFFKKAAGNNNNNNLNKSLSPEGKVNKFFNNSGSNFYNNNANSSGSKGFMNNTNSEKFDLRSNYNNKSNVDANSAGKNAKNLAENFQNKTFYALSNSKKMRNFSYRKYSAGFKKKFNLETEENCTSTIENQNVYDKENFKAFKHKSKRLSQSFDLEKKETLYVKTDTDTMIKFFKEKNKKRKEILLMNHTNKLFNRNYLLENRRVDNNPGPGYYLEEKMYTSFKPHPLPEEKQTFGSISQRFPYLKTADSLGPGAYFREDFKTEKSKQKIHKEKTMIPQFNKLKSYKPIKVEHNVLPGPGEYEADKPKKRVMTAAAAANFGSKEPRFKKPNLNEAGKNPGPGSYNNADYWAARDTARNSNGFNSFAKILVKPNSANPHRNLNYRENNFAIDADEYNNYRGNNSNNVHNNLLNNLHNNNEKNAKKQARMEFIVPEGPGVGAYNADAIYSLEYKIAKNCAKNSLVEAPFNSTKTRPRFDDERKITQNVLGPGIYHKSENKKFKQIYPAFKNTEKRFREAKSQYKTNPGQYDTTSYFDWNKKTFNILYL